MEEDRAGKHFGKATPVALQACREIDGRIEGIATKALTPKEFAAAPGELALIQAFLNSAQCANLETGGRSGSFFRIDRDYRQRLSVRGRATVFGPQLWGASHRFVVGIDAFDERYFRELTRMPSIGPQRSPRGCSPSGAPSQSVDSFHSLP